MAAGLSNKNMVLCLVLMIGSFGLCLVSTHAELRRFEQPAKTDGTLSFLVLGDWGRKGAFNQSEVALQMGRIGEKLDIDFVVSTGDNFYDDGLTGEQDKAFEESFTQIYTAKSLQKQWYSVLGNHDYRGNAEAQLSLHLRKIDSRWLCLRSFIVDAELAEIFFVDTTPFVQSYFTDAEGHTYDWRGIGSPRAYIANLIKDLKLALSESSAKWKIVVGHHSIRSIGHHGDTKELVSKLLPILKANKVDFYMNGHDHCLEHIGDTERYTLNDDLAEFYRYHEKVRLASSVLNSDELTVTFHYGLYVKLGPGNKPATLQHHLQTIFVPRISCPSMKMDKLHVFYFEQDKVRNFLESGYDEDPGWIWSSNTIQC
ncbi:hypothetical protein D5086_023043 [Populus alba]|uniref:Uncharacterized protein n=1 Tax=Populus alba TaxID=43335 RepID=A0ACC4BA64_POPAL